MPASALLLVLGAAVAHAGWNVLAHGASRLGLPFLWWAAVAATLLWLPVVPLTGGVGTDDLASFGLGVAVSGVLHIAYMIVLQGGYARGDLSTVYATARGSGPVLSVIGAVLRGHWRAVIAFGVLSPLSYILVLTAVRMAPLSLVAPMREVSVVLVSVWGGFVLAEGRPVARMVAAIAVAVGVVLIALGGA